jgi:hypothetical protein
MNVNNRWFKYFSHGYTCFSPSEVIIYHLWTRSYRPTFWENSKNEKSVINKTVDDENVFYLNQVVEYKEDFIEVDVISETKKSKQKIYDFLSGEGNMDSFDGFGKERSFEEFCEYIGINFEKREVLQKAKNGDYKDLF